MTEITIFKSRSLKVKKTLYSAIIENLAKPSRISGDDILIVINEPSLENWGIKGGKMPNKVDLSFDIDV